MIEPHELRIGNFVEVENYKIIQLENIHPKGTTKGDEIYLSSMLKPIQLNEEWLLKFGFDKRTNYQFIGNKITIESWNHKASFDVRLRLSEESSVIICEIKYVHQFQNLTFALTGEELKIKES